MGLLFCKDHQLLLVHLGTREGEPCVGTRSWAWTLKETKIKVDKRVSEGLLIFLVFFALRHVTYGCVPVCFSTPDFFASQDFRIKDQFSPSGVCERRLQMRPYTCCRLSHNFSEGMHADRTAHRPVAGLQ